MTNRERKLDLIQKIKDRGIYYKQSGAELITRCPFCGDSENYHKGHFYIRINPDDNYKIVYHCFKCESSGILDKDTLSLLGIDDVGSGSDLETLNKTSDKMDTKGLYENEKKVYKSFPFTIPDGITKHENKIAYVEERLKHSFSIEELEGMKIVPSIYDFLHHNNITQVTFDIEFMNLLEKYFVGFLSYGNAYLLLRNITNQTFGSVPNWVKYPITKDSKDMTCFYSTGATIDIFSEDSLTINLSEGVFDAVSVAFLLGGYDYNNMNIAVTGKYYTQVLLHLLDLGFVGDNVILNIYADNDVQFNKKAKNPTTPEYFRRVLSKYSHLYKEVNLYYNLIQKDFGVPRDEMKIQKIKL